MQTVDDIYEYIGQVIFDNSPPDWSLATLKAKLAEGVIGVKGHFLVGGETVYFSDIIRDRELRKAIKKLNKITSSDSESKWNRMEYILEPSGKFKVNFEWDQEWVDEMERLANE